MGGCTPEPPKIPSRQIQPRHDSVQVDDFTVGVEGIAWCEKWLSGDQWQQLKTATRASRKRSRNLRRDKPHLVSRISQKCEQRGSIGVPGHIRDILKIEITELDVIRVLYENEVLHDFVPLGSGSN